MEILDFCSNGWVRLGNLIPGQVVLQGYCNENMSTDCISDSDVNRRVSAEMDETVNIVKGAAEKTTNSDLHGSELHLTPLMITKHMLILCIRLNY